MTAPGLSLVQRMPTGDSLGDGEDLPEMRKNLIREQSGRHLFQLPGTCSYLRYGVHLLRVRAASPVHCFCAEISWADGYRPHCWYGDARPDGGPSPGNRTDVRFDFARAHASREGADSGYNQASVIGKHFSRLEDMPFCRMCCCAVGTQRRFGE